MSSGHVQADESAEAQSFFDEIGLGTETEREDFLNALCASFGEPSAQVGWADGLTFDPGPAIQPETVNAQLVTSVK